jgi:pterin-4a-carbinolamine dehydratase
MSEPAYLPDGWQHVRRPPSLFRRFEFGSYAETRAFLDRMSALSEQTGLYPDLGFGRTHVNVTVHASGGAVPTDAEIEFARRVAELAQPGPR